MFEPRRFVELRKKPFWLQFLSSESTGMGIFYTLNVFCIQARLQHANHCRLRMHEQPIQGHVATDTLLLLWAETRAVPCV